MDQHNRDKDSMKQEMESIIDHLRTESKQLKDKVIEYMK